MLKSRPFFETILFDFDDTLIANTYKYHAPIWRCGLLITEALGTDSIYPPDLMEMRTRIDAELVEKHGFGVTRFPESWVSTYERLCERLGRPADPGVALRLRVEAERFQEGPFTPFEGVIDMLVALKGEGRRLCLVTAGDFSLQDRKIASSGLGRYFDDVHITERSKKAYLESNRGSEPARTMMVGDSKRSDIIPAIDLGLTAVHVESQTWHYAQADVKGTYHRISTVQELPGLIVRLETATR